MLVLGADIPLVEIIFVLAVITFILLLEAVIIVSLLISQTNKNKRLVQTIEKLSENLLAIKKAELGELDKLKRK